MLFLRTNYKLLPLTKTCSRRDQVSADYVLLHSLESIALATDCSLVENLGRFLERSSRHEALCTEGCTCNTLKHLCCSCLDGIAHLNELQIASLEIRVLVAQLAYGKNLSLVAIFRIAWVGNNLLTPDPVVLFQEVELINKFLFEECCIS